jgi:hypothetical protein
MTMLSSINAMRSNIDQANALVAQLTPLHEAFDAEAVNIEDLDRSKTYFGVNEDGTATLVRFDPVNGAPSFSAAEPLPEVVEVVGESAVPMSMGADVPPASAE